MLADHPLHRIGRGISCVVVQIAALVTRIMIGQAFMQTGHGKLSDLSKPTMFFHNLGIPFPHANAIFIGSLELVGGFLLIIGLATRPFAALLGCTMIVAIATAEWGSFVSALAISPQTGLTDITPVVFLVFLLWLVGFGPGRVSIDYLIARIWNRNSYGPSAQARADIP